MPKRKKENAEYFDRLLRLVFTKWFTKFFMWMGYNANYTTFVSFIVVLFACLGFYYRLYVFGGILVLLYGIMDCCDGEIARLRGESSKLGYWLDATVGFVANAAIIVFICLGINTMTAYLVGMFAILAFPMQNSLIYFYKNEIAESKELMVKEGLLSKIKYLYGTQMFNVGLFVFCLFSRPLLWLAVFAIGANLFWIGTIFIQWRSLK